jgi:hypothetical protein
MLLDSSRSQPNGLLCRSAECDYDALRENFDITLQESSGSSVSNSWSRFAGHFVSKARGGKNPIFTLSSHVAKSMVQAQFIITSNGSLAMVPFDSRIGDEIYVLAGGNMPFVLRPSGATFSPPGSSGARHSCYTLIGECYLDQYMDGQMANKLRDEAVDIFIV